MRKLHLDLDRLKVDSFVTAETSQVARGTVRGHAQNIPTIPNTTGWSLENHTLNCPSLVCPSQFCEPADPNTPYRISEACHEWTEGVTE